MTYFRKSLQAWGSSNFKQIVQQEILQLDEDSLPLQQGLQHSNYAKASNLETIILNVSDNIDFIFIKAGLFYQGAITGCHCADDPSSADDVNEYCVVMIKINKKTARITTNLTE